MTAADAKPEEPNDGIERGEIVDVPPEAQAEPEIPYETVTGPAKVMRIGSMVKQLLDEVKGAELDAVSRERLGEIYERSIVELADALSPDLQQELRMLTLPFRDGEPPTMGELRIAQAQLVGWLEGLFHGIQATLFAQQLSARQQLEQMRGIAPGAHGQPGQLDPRLISQGPNMPQPQSANDRPGTYL